MQDTLEKAVNAIVNPMIQVAFALATILFVYGIFEFIRNADNPETREQGRQHMLWGLIGLAIMIAVFTIIDMLLNTLGISGDSVPQILKQ
jgi:uncharacterized membrane protein YjfL (UPF0719 family)